jgi:hypothetical protein
MADEAAIPYMAMRKVMWTYVHLSISSLNGAPMDLSRLSPQPKTGAEFLHVHGAPLPVTLLDFWRWSTSDLVSNTTRGRLAEFIVAAALAIPVSGVRDEWATWDLTTPEGITVEVKSAAYVQSWHQHRLSAITFATLRTRAWDPETNRQTEASARHAQVYVFALLAHQEKATIDPLNLGQWQFYVLPTAVLNARKRSQHSITLPSLMALCGTGLSYAALRAAVLRAAGYDPVEPLMAPAVR